MKLKIIAAKLKEDAFKKVDLVNLLWEMIEISL